ncbi:unnamed protein product [Vicia faba]|uniref:Uncharacterized protein n=1 Tax=Vicia faba TaxID=3906 RepID=A0AAV0ZSC3_VICFA|nr:unnamed protein product [Vicia faba]
MLKIDDIHESMPMMIAAYEEVKIEDCDLMQIDDDTRRWWKKVGEDGGKRLDGRREENKEFFWFSRFCIMNPADLSKIRVNRISDICQIEADFTGFTVNPPRVFKISDEYAFPNTDVMKVILGCWRNSSINDDLRVLE